MPNRTPFHSQHVAKGGKVVDFHGWELPVQYSTITLEHTAVREKMGLFDISHMGQVLVWGPAAKAYLQFLISNDVEKAVPGKGIYAHLLTPEGTVIDDIFVYNLDGERYLVIINASRREVDEKWMADVAKKFDVTVLEAPFAAALALQGPLAHRLVERLSEDAAGLKRFGIGTFPIGEGPVQVARTGYTGEDGFEFFAPAGHLLVVWDMLFKKGADLGLTPCGLGARDTLRTEAGYPLYGNELDEAHTPFEAGLDWVVKLDKGDFIGRDALLKQKEKGLERRLVGFKVTQGGISRHGAEIVLDGKPAGVVTSGTFSPTLNVAIGMGYAPATLAREGGAITLRQGAREMQAVTVRLPFVKKPLPAAV